MTILYPHPCYKKVCYKRTAMYSRGGGLKEIICSYCITFIWVKVFRINPEFRILRLTFHRKSASKC